MADGSDANLEWSEDFYSVGDLLGNFHFPLIVQVYGGNYGEDNCTTFSNGELLKIHGTQVVNFLECLLIIPGYEDTPVHIPLSHAGRFQILPKKDPSHVYHTVGSLVEDFPQAVIVGKPFAVGTRVVNEGDILELSAIDRRCTQTGVKEFLTCRHNERDIALNLDIVGDFIVYQDEYEYTISEFINFYRLPQRIRFTSTQETLFQSLSSNLLDFLRSVPNFSWEFVVQTISCQNVLVASTKLVDDAIDSCCRVITIPFNDRLNLSFSVAVNQSDPAHKRVFRHDFIHDINVEGMAHRNYIEYANSPSVFSLAELEEYLEPHPPLLPRKPNTKSDESDDYDDVEFLPSYHLGQSGDSSEEDGPIRTIGIPPRKPTSKSRTRQEDMAKASVSPNVANLTSKHKKNFLHDAKTMFSQSIENLTEKLQKRKQKIPEPPKMKISAPIPQNVESSHPARPSDNYENVFHSLQGGRPLGARPTKGEPKVGIAHPQNFGTMVGTEENTDLIYSEVNDNVINRRAIASIVDEPLVETVPNDYADAFSLRVKLPPWAEPEKASSKAVVKPPIAAKPRMGVKHAADRNSRSLSSTTSFDKPYEVVDLPAKVKPVAATWRRDSGEKSPTTSYSDRSIHSRNGGQPTVPCKPQPQQREFGTIKTIHSTSKTQSITTLNDIPEDLSPLRVQEIASVMRLCGLGNVADKFISEVLDGNLFMQLSEDMLRDHFNLSKFEILKVIKIQKGYRPKL